MSCACKAVERLVAGSEVRLPFLIETGDTPDIVNLQGDVTAEVRAYGEPVFTLAVGDGIEIEDPFPPRAANDVLQIPHGFIVMSEARTELLRSYLGRIATLRIQFVSETGETAFTENTLLEVSP